eukprot:m.638484 g.638484  ORF g.638484 m.638484 type:complete len:404 (-) comp22606_c1_seq6:3537-4748(-)
MAMYQNVAEIVADSSTPPYQYGILSRTEVNQKFSQPGNNVEGAFLVRESSKRKGDFVLSVVLGGRAQHYVITVQSSGFNIDDGPQFPSLHELMEYYMHHPESPTRITKPICRVGTSMESWLAANGADGGDTSTPASSANETVPDQDAPPPLLPRSSGSLSGIRTMSNASTISNPELYENAQDALQKSAPPPEPVPEPVAPRAVDPPRAVEPQPTPKEPEKKSWRESVNLEERSDFRKVGKVKEVLDKQDLVNSMDVQAREVVQEDGAFVANQRAIQFEKEAVATEKMNLFWINNKLKKIEGETQVTDVKESIANGVRIMKVLELISGKKAPRYAKNPTLEVQIRDNWACVVRFMESLGIEVTAHKTAKDEDASVGLDPDALGELDRREVLKLFSKIMLYENTL